MRGRLIGRRGREAAEGTGSPGFHTLPPSGRSPPTACSPGYRAVTFGMNPTPRILLLALALTACGDRSSTVDTVSDADIREYRLTDEALGKWQQIQLRSARNPGLTVASDPRQAPEGIDGRAASYMIRTFESSPAVAADIADEGLTPREFVLVTLALYHAIAGQGATEIPPEILTSRENLAFVAANRTMINQYYAEQVTARQQALEGAAPR
jgi:hypothetical protein